jgi:hypothetical protein
MQVVWVADVRNRLGESRVEHPRDRQPRRRLTPCLTGHRFSLDLGQANTAVASLAVAAIAVTALAVNERIVALAAAALCLIGMALVLFRDERLSWHDGLLDLTFLLAVATAASVGCAGGVR